MRVVAIRVSVSVLCYKTDTKPTTKIIDDHPGFVFVLFTDFCPSLFLQSRLKLKLGLGIIIRIRVRKINKNNCNISIF